MGDFIWYISKNIEDTGIAIMAKLKVYVCPLIVIINLVNIYLGWKVIQGQILQKWQKVDLTYLSKN